MLKKINVLLSLGKKNVLRQIQSNHMGDNLAKTVSMSFLSKSLTYNMPCSPYIIGTARHIICKILCLV